MSTHIFTDEIESFIKSALDIDQIPSYIPRGPTPNVLTTEAAHLLVFHSIINRFSSVSSSRPNSSLIVLRSIVSRSASVFATLSTTPPPSPSLAGPSTALASAALFLLLQTITRPCLFVPGKPGPLQTASGTFLLTTLLNVSQVERGALLGALADPASPAIREDAVLCLAETLCNALHDCRTPEEYAPLAALLYEVSGYRELAKIIQKSPVWAPEDGNGADMEDQTLLGALLSIGASPKDNDRATWNDERFFPLPLKLGISEVESEWQEQRLMYRGHVICMGNVFLRFMKADKDALLRWCAMAVEKNRDLKKTRVDSRTVASTAFMFNLMQVLLQLSQPMTTKPMNSLGLDPLYMHRDTSLLSPQLDSFLMSVSEIKEYVEKKPASGPPSFATHIFFLLIETIDITLSTLLSKRRMFGLILGRERREVGAQQDALMKAAEPNRINLLFRKIILLDGLIRDDVVLKKIESFLSLSSGWMLQLLNELEGPSNISFSFMALPESFVTTLSSFLTCVSCSSTTFLELGLSWNIFLLASRLIGDSEHIRNTSLRYDIVQALGKITGEAEGESPDSCATANCSILESTCSNGSGLIEAIFNFYISLEVFGRDLGFYAKFNARNDVHNILWHMWQQYSIQKIMESFLKSTDPKKREIILLAGKAVVSDLNFMLEDVIENVRHIVKIENEQRSPNWRTMSEEERSQEISRMTDAQGSVRSSGAMYKDSMKLFRILVVEAGPEVTSIFMDDEQMAQDLANLFNYYLSQLLLEGADSLTECGARFGFDSNELFRNVTEIMAKLNSNINFVHCLWQDQRCYKPELYTSAIRKMNDVTSGVYPWVVSFESLAKKVEQDKEKYAAVIEALDVFPEEFADALTGDLMQDPVKIPGDSDAVIDRKTVKRLIETGDRNPYTREPLKETDITPVPELKVKIDQWKKEQVSKIGK